MPRGVGMDPKDLEVPPASGRNSLGKERRGPNAEAVASRAGARGSVVGTAVSFSVTDWQRLTEIISKIWSKSAQSDE
jgi:hypothetical protein